MRVPLSILHLLLNNLLEFSKVWAKHNFNYIRFISVYIQHRYFDLIFRSVNANNMNGVILHSVRPSFWKKRGFSHAPRCGSTESGCEISVPWWLISADRGKMTSVWSWDRDTGDTSEGATRLLDSTGITWSCSLTSHPYRRWIWFVCSLPNNTWRWALWTWRAMLLSVGGRDSGGGGFFRFRKNVISCRINCIALLLGVKCQVEGSSSCHQACFTCIHLS